MEVHTDSEGVLSDSHWSGGLIGYFPSYAIGSAFAAQLEARLRSVMDLDGALRSGGLSDVRAYLREHLHRFAASRPPPSSSRARPGAVQPGLLSGVSDKKIQSVMYFAQ